MAEKPSVLNEEEEVEEEPLAVAGLGDKEVEATATSDEIALPDTRLNVRNFVGKLVLIKSFKIRPTPKEAPDGTVKIMYVSYIDGCVIEDETIIEKVRKSKDIDPKLKEAIAKACREVKLYSTSAGVAVSLNNYVRPAMAKGAVLVYVNTKKSKYPQDMVVLEAPFKSA